MLSSMVLAALTVAPAALASRPNRPTTSGGYQQTTTVQNSKAKCEAKAVATNFKSSQDAHVAAGMLTVHKCFQ
jgi:hypothetical protein